MFWIGMCFCTSKLVKRISALAGLAALSVASDTLATAPAYATFDPTLTREDREFLAYLTTDLPKIVAKREPTELEALNAKLRDAAFAVRLTQKPLLEHTYKSTYWRTFAEPARWMITSSLAMVEGLEKAGKKSSETDDLKARLLDRRGLIEAAEKAYDPKDPKNFKDLVAIATQISQKDDKKLSDLYHRLRALYVPLLLPPAFPPSIPVHEPFEGINTRQWEHSMAEVKKVIQKSKASAIFPAPMRESFEKSLLDLFFAYKAPVMDMKFRAVFETENSDKPVQPDPEASEIGASLRSLLRVTLLSDVFGEIEKKGGMRKAVRELQPKMETIPGLCDRFLKISHLSEKQWKRLRRSGKVILIDSGHLGGEFADDNRREIPADEKGKESYDYREGYDTYLIANLARKLLCQCAKLPESNVLVGRKGLHDEAGYYFNKAGERLEGPPGPTLPVSDNLYFRKAYLAAVKPDLMISIHNDTSDTLTQHGMVIVPRRPLTLPVGFFKTQAQYESSMALAKSLNRALTLTMHSSEGMPAKTSCNEWIRFEYKEYYLHEMDLQVFRDFDGIPSTLIEGFDYQAAPMREFLNSVKRGHRSGDPDVKQLKLDGTDYFFHTVHRCYAEGVALGAVNQILGIRGH